MLNEIYIRVSLRDALQVKLYVCVYVKYILGLYIETLERILEVTVSMGLYITFPLVMCSSHNCFCTISSAWHATYIMSSD